MKYRIHKLVLSKDNEDIEKELKKATKKEINEQEKGMLLTPLFMAVMQGKVEAVKLLLKYGANVNSLDIYGKSPLFYIGEPSPVESANPENLLLITHLLIENGIDITICDKTGNQALWMIVFNSTDGDERKLPIVKYLIEKGADPNHKNNSNNSPLDFAKKVGYKPLIDVLESINNKMP